MSFIFRKSLFYLLLAGILIGGAVAYAHTDTPAVPEPTASDNLSACAIKLEWDQSEKGAYYFEYEGGDAQYSGDKYIEARMPENDNDFFSEAKTGSFVATSTGLISNNNYWFRVRSGNPNASGGSSVVSSWAEFSNPTKTDPLPDKPGTPTLDSVFLDVNNRVVELEFSTSTEFAGTYGGFSIFRSENGGNFEYIGRRSDYSDPEDITTRAVNEFTDNDFDKNTTYAYKVHVYDSDFGCDFDPALYTESNSTDPVNQAVYSEESNTITLPGAPVNPDANFDGVDTIEFSWEMGTAEGVDHYEVWRSTNFNSAPITKETTENTSFSWTYPDFDWNTDYDFKVKACSSPNDSVCSLFSEVASESATVSLGKPSLSARLAYVNAGNGTGDVTGSWTAVDEADGYKLFRATNPDFADAEVVKEEGFCGQWAYSCVNDFESKSKFEFEETLNLGPTYYYRVRAYGLNTTKDSDKKAIDMNVNYVMRGVAWTAEGRDDGSGGKVPVGVGWVKFNSASEGGSGGSSIPYSVQVSSDGTVSGYAWAGDYGWLSFNESDLESRKAEMNLSTGNLSGWARFINVPDGADWDGWVNLSGSDYGVSLDTASLDFSGTAWAGGNVAGWIVFGDSDCSECTVRAEAIINTCQPQNLSATAISSSDIRVEWDNADNDCVDGISLYRSPANQPYASKSSFNKAASFPSANYQSEKGNNISYTDGGLERDTEYAYFVREESVLKKESNIDSATTFRADYNLTCQAISSDEVNVFWTGDSLSGYSISLFGGKTGNFQRLYDTDSGGGNYTHSGLDSDTEYNYEIRIYDGNGNRQESIEPDQPIFCETMASTPEDPSNLEVWPRSSSTLHVTWKDNAVTEHDFKLERIKLTPDNPSGLSVAEASGGLDISWTNTTNNHGEKGPFYHVVERAEDSNFTTAVTSSTEPGSTDYSDTETEFSFFDSEVTAGTDYYYRVKACSYVETDYTRDGIDNPGKHCSDYSSVESGSVAAVQNETWYGTVIEAVKSFFSSLQEKGESMIQDVRIAFAGGIDMDTYFSQWSSDLPFENYPGVYDDTGLDADSAYLYRVKALFTDGGESEYSQTGSGKTLPDGKGGESSAKMCTGNSFCESVPVVKSVEEPIKSQCSNNAECRDVGTSRKVFEEIK